MKGQTLTQYFGIGFLALVFLEVMPIVWVTDQTGDGWTLFMIAVNFINGTFMLRYTGISDLLFVGAAARNDQNISLYQMLWPIHYTTTAVFPLSPGFTSTAVALFLLIPFKGNTPVSSTQFFQSRQAYDSTKDDEGIIEGEYTITRTGKADKLQDYVEHESD